MAPQAKIVAKTADKDPTTQAIFVSHELTIYLGDHLEGFELKYYLFHEIGHCVLFATGLDMVIPAKLQEVICQSFATMMVGLVK